MKYMGSKARIAKHILPIILKDRKEGQCYVEPFVGGANMIDKVDGWRIGGEFNRYIAEMWRELVKGASPITITKEDYQKIKENHDDYPDCGDVGGCVVWRDEDGSINIYLERQGDAIDVSDCAHEAYHAADFIFDRCGIDYNPESGNEHMAYLVGWIVNKIFDCLSDDVKAEAMING